MLKTQTIKTIWKTIRIFIIKKDPIKTDEKKTTILLNNDVTNIAKTADLKNLRKV